MSQSNGHDPDPPWAELDIPEMPEKVETNTIKFVAPPIATYPNQPHYAADVLAQELIASKAIDSSSISYQSGIKSLSLFMSSALSRMLNDLPEDNKFKADQVFNLCLILREVYLTVALAGYSSVIQEALGIIMDAEINAAKQGVEKDLDQTLVEIRKLLAEQGL